MYFEHNYGEKKVEKSLKTKSIFSYPKVKIVGLCIILNFL